MTEAHQETHFSCSLAREKEGLARLLAPSVVVVVQQKTDRPTDRPTDGLSLARWDVKRASERESARRPAPGGTVRSSRSLVS